MHKMANEHHSNPFFSIISGMLSGIYVFIQTNGFFIENGLELIKVIFFGFIGGIFGYVGKHIAERILKKAKDKCE